MTALNRQPHNRTHVLPMMEQLRAAVLWTCPLLALCCIAVLAWSNPRVSDCTYGMGNEQSQSCELPLRMTTGENADITIRFSLHVGLFSPTRFRIVPDDCLQQLSINDTPVDEGVLPVCDYTNGQVFNLYESIYRGDNTVEAVVHNNGGDMQFLLQPAWSDPAIFIPVGIITVALFCFFIAWLARYKRSSWSTPLIMLFILAVVLRMFYLSVTPHWIRGHDTDGHIEYIEHLQREFALPSPDAGWESWQPPLYYITAAVWSAPLEPLGLGREARLFWIQILSFLLSVWTLFLTVQIGTRLFPAGRDRTIGLPLFFGLIAFMPGLVMLSARINNDVLVVSMTFLAFLLLIGWWHSGKRLPWLGCMLAIGLAVLSKSNGLLLLPVAFLCLILRNGWNWKRTMIDGTFGLLVVIVVAGWFTAYRHVSATGQDLLIGNGNVLGSALAVDNSVSAYLTFNPKEVIRMPYNNAWEDAARRQYFWEYLYRSAFFGEFGFGEGRKILASWLIACSFPVFLLALWGWVIGWRHWREYLPLLLVAVILPLGHAAFRFRYPFASSQDFRYIVPFLVPVAFFAVHAWLQIKNGTLRQVLFLCLQTFIVFSAVFQLHI